MNDQTGKKKTPRIWHEKHQEVLKNWGESAACYRYMHFKAYEYYKRTNMLFTLPIIVIGTVTGTANFAQTTFPRSAQPYVPSAIGALNLISAIMTTVAQFLKVAELMESHRVSYINYGKLARSINLEINLPYSERAHHGASMIDVCGSEYDRLIEQCPPVPHRIMKLFLKTFPETEEEKKNLNFSKPEIFTVKPFREFKDDAKPPTDKKSPMKRWESTKKEIIKELEELKDMSIVSHLIIDIPSHPASLDGSDGT